MAMTRLRERYEGEVRPALTEKFKYGNAMQVPKLEKVVLNMSVGEAIVNSKVLDTAASELQVISGQKAVITKAKKSIAAFKLREGMNIGCKVTLRGERMYVFLDKLFNIVLPRIRDFRGLSRKAFDGRGNYNLGLREQIVFPGNQLRQGRQDARYGHRDRHDREDGRGGDGVLDSDGVAAAEGAGRVRSGTGGTINGEDRSHRAIETSAEVQGAPAQPLQSVWASARLLPQVRDVPHLLP